MEEVARARQLAQRLLAESLPRRWAHTQGVAAKARASAAAVGPDAALLEAAAWLHDIGYSPDLVVTGFHPLDGARYLRDMVGADQRLCRLVANHSCAVIEARHRGLANQLTTEFPTDDSIVAQALTYCDMTTSPDGQPVDATSRLQEIINRYGDGHLVTMSMQEAHPLVRRSVETVESLLAGHR